MVLDNPNLLDFERDLFTKPGRARVGVQWKSADICLDIECECGSLSHLCDSMFGHWVCEVCGRAFKPPTIAVAYTDSETWGGYTHPYQALENYRQSSGIDAKLIVNGMTATDSSITNPSDPRSLSVVGFDPAAPKLIADFSRGL